MTENATFRRRRRPFAALAAIVVVGVVAWSGAWIWARSEIITRMDDALARLAARGVVVSCPERGVGGWPFRVVVSCSAPTLRVAAADLAVDVARLVVSGLVTQPNRVIADVAGPIAIRRGDDRFEAQWQSLRFSLGFQDFRPARLSLETAGFDGRARRHGEPEQALRFARGEVQVMPAALVAKAEAAATPPSTATVAPPSPADLRAALTLERTEASLGGIKATPAPVDLFIDAKTSDLPSYRVGPRDLATAGTGLDVVMARIGLGRDLTLEGVGRLTLSDAGAVNGVIEVQPSSATVWPEAPPTPASLKTAFAGTLMMFGTTAPSRTGRGGTRLDVLVNDGVVRVGRLTLAKLRPLF